MKSDDRIERIFPDYCERFGIPPEGAKEESICVYRACITNKLERESFLVTYEENGFKFDEESDKDNPGTFSLSTFEKPKDVKRFSVAKEGVHPPYKIAVGHTEPKHGLVQRTKERVKRKTSHVDWWLYKDARPYEEFELIEDFQKYLDELSGR